MSSLYQVYYQNDNLHLREFKQKYIDMSSCWLFYRLHHPVASTYLIEIKDNERILQDKSLKSYQNPANQLLKLQELQSRQRKSRPSSFI